MRCELGPDAFASSFDHHTFFGQVGFLIDAIFSKSHIRKYHTQLLIIGV